MRTITCKFTVPESYEDDYKDVVAELVAADFFDGNGYDGLEVLSDSAPPAGTPRAVVGDECHCAKPSYPLGNCTNCGLPAASD